MATATPPVVEGPVAPYHDKEKWLELHATGIGGSDAAAVAGFSPYRSRADVYDRKKGLSEGPDPKENSDLRRGIKQEPIAAEKYVEVTGRKIRRQPMRRHPEHDWMICDIDRQIVGLEDGPMLLELKVPRVASFYEIRDRGLPDQYIIQLHHNMVCWGYDRSSFGVYTPEYDDLIFFDVALDEELAAWLVEEERAFWRDHVVPEVRPGPNPTEPPPELPDMPGEATVFDDGDWHEAAREFRRADAQKEIAEQDYDRAKERLVELAEQRSENDAFRMEGGGVRIKRYWNKGRCRFEKEMLLNAHPEIELDDFYVRGDPYAVTKVKATVPPDADDLEVPR